MTPIDWKRKIGGLWRNEITWSPILGDLLIGNCAQPGRAYRPRQESPILGDAY